MNCPTCYNQVPETSSFCPACGTRIKFNSNIYPNTQQPSYQPHQYLPNNYNVISTPPQNIKQKNMVFHYIFAIMTLVMYGPSCLTQLFSTIVSFNNFWNALINFSILLFGVFAVATAILLLAKKKIGYYFSKVFNILSSLEGGASLFLGAFLFIEGIKDNSEYAILLYLLAFLFLGIGAAIAIFNIIAFVYYTKRKDFFS